MCSTSMVPALFCNAGDFRMRGTLVCRERGGHEAPERSPFGKITQRPADYLSGRK